MPQFIQRQLSQFPTGVLPVGTKKCWLILHANIFLQTTKGIKLKTAQKPLPPPLKNVTFIGTLKRRYIFVLHQANYNSIRRNGGFSVHRHVSINRLSPYHTYPAVCGSASPHLHSSLRLFKNESVNQKAGWNVANLADMCNRD